MRTAIVFFVLVFAVNTATAQWVQTNVNEPAGERVMCFVVSGPNLFVGTMGGGVFLSTNNGTSWTAVNNGLMGAGVWALAVSPNGAGDTNLFTGTSWYNNGGVFRSTNNGASWTQVNNGLTSTDVQALAVSPNGADGTNVFAGTGNGGCVFRSTNNGASWNLTSLTSSWVGALAVIGTTLFAATGGGGGIFRSTDNGASWTAAGLTSQEVHCFAVNGTNLFAGVHGGVFLSTDFGTSWTPVNNGLTNTIVSALAVSGTNLFAGTFEGVFLSTNNGTNWTSAGLTNTGVPALAVSNTNLFAATSICSILGCGGVSLSTNNGASWTVVNNGLTYTGVSVLHVSGTNLFVGAHSGAFRSTDNGTSWTAAGLTNTNVRAFAVSSSNLFAGTDGGVFLSTNNGTSWTAVNSGLTNTHVGAFAVSGTNLFAGTDGGVFLSTNNGTSWTAINSGLTNTNVGAFAVSGTNLFAGTDGGVFLSTNNGTSWTAVNSGLTNTHVGAFAVSGTNLFVGTDGGVFLSTNNGTNWTAVVPELTNTIVNSFAVNGMSIFAGTNLGVYSFSSGWVNTGLVDTLVHTLAVSDTNLFAGAVGSGVWGRPLSEMIPSVGQIKITILYDNTAFVPGTTADWGFSCFMQSARDTLLYDAGTYGTILLGNANTLGANLSSVKKMFLSHDHSDHAGGITTALAQAPAVPVYVGALFSPSVIQTIVNAGGQPVLVTGAAEVSGGYYSTGELPSSIGTYEHSLVMDTDSGLVVVVGCSHPGIIEMLRRVKAGLGREIFAVFGGFHLLDLTQTQVEAIIQELRNLGVRKCGATHCTGASAIQWISQAYGSDFLPMGVGRVLQFSASTVPVNSPRLWLSRGAIDFGHVELGSRPDTVTVTVENISPRPLTVSEISHSNGAFELVGIPQLPVTVQSGTPLVLRAVFHPAASQLYSDTIRIVSDDMMMPVRVIPLQGEGFVVVRASENTLYALGGRADSGNVRIVDPVTGATRLVGRSGCAQIAGARVSPSTGEIIALAPTGSFTSVVRLSAAGSHFATIAQWSTADWKGIAFRGDTLYLTRAYWLYRWDMRAPAPTFVRAFPSRYVFSGLAYRSGQDDFLASVGTTGTAADSLYRIEPDTWTITAVGPVGMKPVADILFDGAANLFGVLTSDSSESLLLTINPETGAATTIGPMGARGIMALAVQGIATGIGITEVVPTGFRLSQNYPNPFNPVTDFQFSIVNRQLTILKVYDILGREVATLVNEVKLPGTYTVQWDASGVASGVYFYRLHAGGFVETKRLVVLR